MDTIFIDEKSLLVYQPFKVLKNKMGHPVLWGEGSYMNEWWWKGVYAVIKYNNYYIILVE